MQTAKAIALKEKQTYTGEELARISRSELIAIHKQNLRYPSLYLYLALKLDGQERQDFWISRKGFCSQWNVPHRNLPVLLEQLARKGFIRILHVNSANFHILLGE